MGGKSKARKPWVDTPARQAARARAQAAHAERCRQRREVQEREAGSCKVVGCGIDTLNLWTKAELKPALVQRLKQLKLEAIDARAEHRADLPRWSVNGVQLEVQPHGSKKASLMARTLEDEAVVAVNADSDPNLPTVHVELKAQMLWRGWDSAADWATSVFRELCVDGAELDVQVSRLDLAVDFMGWSPEPSIVSDLYGRVVRRDKNYERLSPELKNKADDQWLREHFGGRTFTGFTFGGGPMMMRVYNKSLKAMKDGARWWFEMWREKSPWRSVDEDGHVWRAEAQLRREPLTHSTITRGADESPISSWAAARTALNALWHYLLTRWLSYRLPRIGNERVRLHPRWRILLAARFVDQADDGRLHRYQVTNSLRRTIGALTGYLRRGIAETWYEQGSAPYKARLASDFEALIARADAHHKTKHDGDLFSAAVEQWEHQEKVRRLFAGKKPGLA